MGIYIFELCVYCYGLGKVKEIKMFEVKILVGIDDGMWICLVGNGELGINGGLLGDLYVEIYIKLYLVFECDGDDFYC